MRYSEFPHEFYLTDGEGPGAEFLGDLERWNWRYLLFGEAPENDADHGLKLFFNTAQRELMRLPPMEALERMHAFMEIPPEAWDRAQEAEDRLFPVQAATVKSNVIYADFGRNRDATKVETASDPR